VIGLDKNTAMPLANLKTITDDVTHTLLFVSFKISSPCTKMNSHTRLFNAAASSPSRRREREPLGNYEKIDLRSKQNNAQKDC